VKTGGTLWSAVPNGTAEIGPLFIRGMRASPVKGESPINRNQKLSLGSMEVK
jgi:hypothetical protein